MTDVVSGALQVDLKRRTTLPGNVLAAAGIPPGSTLVARVEEPGRIVLESPQLLLTLLQDDIAAALGPSSEVGSELQIDEVSLVDQLLAERDADTSPGGPGTPETRQAGAHEADASTSAGTADQEGRA